jgi:hypothetical protein
MSVVIVRRDEQKAISMENLDHFDAIRADVDENEQTAPPDGYMILWQMLFWAAGHLGVTQEEINRLDFESVIDDLTVAYNRALQKLFRARGSKRNCRKPEHDDEWPETARPGDTSG